MDAKTVAEDRSSGQTKRVGFWEAFWFWVKLGFINFGGPAGQIAIMHKELVEKKRWVSEKQYLRTPNFCMLLPGPERSRGRRRRRVRALTPQCNHGYTRVSRPDACRWRFMMRRQDVEQLTHADVVGHRRFSSRGDRGQESDRPCPEHWLEAPRRRRRAHVRPSRLRVLHRDPGGA